MNLFWIKESFCTKTAINRPLFSSSKEILESFQLTSTFEKSKAIAHFEINDKNDLKKLKIEKLFFLDTLLTKEALGSIAWNIFPHLVGESLKTHLKKHIVFP